MLTAIRHSHLTQVKNCVRQVTPYRLPKGVGCSAMIQRVKRVSDGYYEFSIEIKMCFARNVHRSGQISCGSETGCIGCYVIGDGNLVRC